MTYAEGRALPIRTLSAEDVRSMMADAPDDMIPTLRNLLILKSFSREAVRRG